jgi:tRNA modification GTPase
MSGDKSLAITQSIFRGASLKEAPSHTIHYGWITDGEKDIDEVMVSVFRAPRSFTTEDSTEITCHGSPRIVQSIIELAIKKGARLAEPGEFTLRAFLNGRIDLSQAEAVADLIHSTSNLSSELALKQIKGQFSRVLADLRQELVDFAALIELELDFSEEDVEFANREKLKTLVHKIQNIIKPLMDSFSWGNSIKEGIPVAIVGAPNAGKSTLLNTLLNEEKAIVSDIAGTTRDFIEDVLFVDGVSFRFTDTAGIRDTEDALESLGIERSFQKMNDARIVLYLMDIRRETDDLIAELNSVPRQENQSFFVLLNKADTLSAGQSQDTSDLIYQRTTLPVCHIAARDRRTLTPVFEYLSAYIRKNNPSEGTVITSSRHFEALSNTSEALDNVLRGMDSQLPTDLVAMDIREALYHLGTITGQVSTDDLLESIFTRFCIGK